MKICEYFDMDFALPAWYYRQIWQEWDMGEIYDRLCPRNVHYIPALEECKVYEAYWNHHALYKASIFNTWQIAFNLLKDQIPCTVLISGSNDDTYLQVQFPSGTVYIKANTRPFSKHEVYIGFVDHLQMSDPVDIRRIELCVGIRFEDGRPLGGKAGCLKRGKREFESTTQG